MQKIKHKIKKMELSKGVIQSIISNPSNTNSLFAKDVNGVLKKKMHLQVIDLENMKKKNSVITKTTLNDSENILVGCILNSNADTQKLAKFSVIEVADCTLLLSNGVNILLVKEWKHIEARDKEVQHKNVHRMKRIYPIVSVENVIPTKIIAVGLGVQSKIPAQTLSVFLSNSGTSTGQISDKVVSDAKAAQSMTSSKELPARPQN